MSKFVNYYTLRRENKEKDKSLEVILQRDLSENMPTNSKIPHFISKQNPHNLKRRDNDFDKRQGQLTEEDLDLIRAAFFKHFLFSDLSEDIMLGKKLISDQIMEQI